MPRKKREKDKTEKPESRAEKRSKKVTIDDVPQIVIDLPDEGMQRAAMVLATCGYRKGSKRRNGAVIYAARQAGVSRETIYNWLDDPQFEDAIQEVNSMLVQECFAGLRMCVLRADAKGIVELLARLDPELDLAWLRELARMEHEKEMLRLKIELAAKGGDEDAKPLPTIMLRMAAPRAEELN